MVAAPVAPATVTFVIISLFGTEWHAAAAVAVPAAAAVKPTASVLAAAAVAAVAAVPKVLVTTNTLDTMFLVLEEAVAVKMVMALTLLLVDLLAYLLTILKQVW